MNRSEEEEATGEWAEFGQTVLALWRSRGCDCSPAIVVLVDAQRVHVRHKSTCALASVLKAN